MEQKKQNEALAAITLALHEYQGYTVHVQESGVLTIGSEMSDETFQSVPLNPT